MNYHTIYSICLHEAGHLAAARILTFMPLEAFVTERKGSMRNVRPAGRTQRRYKRKPSPTTYAACVQWALSMAPTHVDGAMQPGRSDRRAARKVQRFLPCKSMVATALNNMMDDGHVRFFVARTAMFLHANGKATSSDIDALARDAGLVGRKYWDLLTKFYSDCEKTKEDK